ncbi:MAG: alkaline phosphatase family protein [Flavobacteriales bacterium]|nr:alkaline phosphatase family protein [Flavobacteriales bacterium]
MKYLLAFGSVVQWFIAATQPTWQDPPKLVVAVVVDQMRADYIYRYWDNYGEGGFKRLVNEGAFCRDAHYPYGPTDTGPGHASIHTGSVPAYHGIVANDRYVRSLGRTAYCVEDTLAQVIGTGEPAAGRSPRPLQASTLADELERATNGKSKTISISLKDRSAVLPIGRTGDAAYWFHGTTGFVSSDWYMAALPSWITAFNTLNPMAGYMQGTWDLLLPAERYQFTDTSHNAFERIIPGAEKAELPLDLDALRMESTAGEAFLHTPGGNTILVDLALIAIEAEGLGADTITDMLSISFSATDKLGHRTGPLSLELEDMYIRLDREIERLLKGLDAAVGGNYTLFLTADHGVLDVPAYRASKGANGGYLDLRAVRADVEEYLQQAYGPGPWVSYVNDDVVFLDRTLVRAKGLDLAELQAAAAMVAQDVSGLLDVYSSSELERNPPREGPGLLLARGHHVQRGADLYFLPMPGYESTFSVSRGLGADHGSTWTYDTHVPLLFFGEGVRPGEVLRRVAITDIAPTLAMILGCALPDAAIGVAIPEVLR